jgi:hypothetical protein
MSKEENNKAVVGHWFTEFWGNSVNIGVVDEIAAPDMLVWQKYSADFRAVASNLLLAHALADSAGVALSPLIGRNPGWR